MMAKTKDVERVAQALGISPQTLRYGLRQGAFPFGTVIECKGEYAYVLYPKLVKDVVGIEIGENEEKG